MKRISMILVTIALVLGLSQCKKQEQSSSNEENIVPITLDVRANGGSRIDVNTANGAVSFETGDVVYVASGQKFVGTLTNNGNTFAGNLTNPTEGEPLYFFFLGNKTPEEVLTPGSSTSCSVNISDQTSGYPVISFATSNETFTGAGLYTAYFLNKAALVKFDVTSFSSTPTCILGLNNKVTVDFSTNAFAYSQVDNGLVKLPGRSGDRWAILLPQAALTEGEEGSVYTVNGQYIGTRPAIPAITANDYLNEGITLNVMTLQGTIPEGAVSGVYTINGNGDRVFFSQGNLQYQASTNTWRFAENQWDLLVTSDDMTLLTDWGDHYADVSSQYTSTSSAWIDLFGWGTSGYNHGAVCYQPWSTSQTNSDYLAYGSSSYNLFDQTGQADWGYNAISNGGNAENLWRTLTKDEWQYLFNSRSTLSGRRYAKGIVDGVKGIILLPDNWTTSTYWLNNTNYEWGGFDNFITATEWTSVLEANGAVFLPAAGIRFFGTSVFNANVSGVYWTASYFPYYDNVCSIDFGDGGMDIEDHYSNRSYGSSVRLVRSTE